MTEEMPKNIAAPHGPLPAIRFGVWLLIPLVLSIVVLFILSMEWKDSLKVEHVVVTGSHIVPAEDIYSWARIELKSPLYGVDVSRVQERLSSHPFLKTVTVSRQIPDVFRIQVAERIPVASLSSSQMRYVDAEGVLLPYLDSPVKLDLPVISGVAGVEQVHTGEVMTSNELFQAIEILSMAGAIDSSLYHFISEINMSGGGDVVLYSNDVVVPILIGRGDFGKKLVLLHTFWNSFVKTNDSKRLQYIDLRYGEQVVVKWNQQS